MNANIFCPNCTFDHGKKSFYNDEGPKEFKCDCNLPFELNLIEEGHKTNKLHDDIILQMHIVSEKQQWRKVDQNLSPVIHCVLCKNKIIKDINEEDEFRCDNCGCRYAVNIEEND